MAGERPHAAASGARAADQVSADPAGAGGRADRRGAGVQVACVRYVRRYPPAGPVPTVTCRWCRRRSRSGAGSCGCPPRWLRPGCWLGRFGSARAVGGRGHTSRWERTRKFRGVAGTRHVAHRPGSRRQGESVVAGRYPRDFAIVPDSVERFATMSLLLEPAGRRRHSAGGHRLGADPRYTVLCPEGPRSWWRAASERSSPTMSTATRPGVLHRAIRDALRVGLGRCRICGQRHHPLGRGPIEHAG